MIVHSSKFIPNRLPSSTGRLIIRLALVSLLTLVANSDHNQHALVSQIRFMAGKSGRTDYALTGESIELSCIYMMKDEAEQVRQIIWFKDGKNFLRWRKGRAGLEVLSYTFKGHIDQQSTGSRLTIHNTTIDMHGKYKCQIKTDLGISELEENLIVVSSSGCKLSDWHIVSQSMDCGEFIELNCKNMFPRPVPSCGLWDSKTEKFIRSIHLDINEEANKQTFQVSYQNNYWLNAAQNSDLLPYAGHLIFKCDISIPDTSWHLSLSHRMFNYNDACHQDPLEAINQMRHKYSSYAGERLHRAGYIITSHRSPPTTATNDTIPAASMDDQLEMLASSLDFQLLSRANSTAGFRRFHPAELNCWRKPKIGTLARLSCKKSSRGNPVRMTGAGWLQCQPSGWVPLASNTRLLSSSEQLATGTSESSSGAAGRQQRLSFRVHRSHVDSDDSDDSRSDTNSLTEQLTTDMSVSTEVELVDTKTTPLVNQDEEQEITTGSPSLPDLDLGSLTPAQLGALLPTCVSTVDRYNPHGQRSDGFNKLPLHDQGVNWGHGRHPIQIPTSNQESRSIFNLISSNYSVPVRPSMVILLLFSSSTLLMLLHISQSIQKVNHQFTCGKRNSISVD